MTSNCVRRVLLPIDGSEHSKRAVNWYLSEFSRPDDFAYFFHVVEANYSKSTANETHDHGKEISHIQMEYVMQVGSKPGELIINAAKERSVDVILIGNRGLGAFRRTFLGSVSDS
ncbi:unnamed protein product [Schistosoma intercalatum]|nr:unnamed protein product [Schistosoma intercalatum]CAH8618089.1 unnamed protein product [Schistosoma intercalatum]